MLGYYFMITDNWIQRWAGIAAVWPKYLRHTELYLFYNVVHTAQWYFSTSKADQSWFRRKERIKCHSIGRHAILHHYYWTASVFCPISKQSSNSAGFMTKKPLKFHRIPRKSSKNVENIFDSLLFWLIYCFFLSFSDNCEKRRKQNRCTVALSKWSRQNCRLTANKQNNHSDIRTKMQILSFN